MIGSSARTIAKQNLLGFAAEICAKIFRRDAHLRKILEEARTILSARRSGPKPH
jgi:hypothetical protein